MALIFNHMYALKLQLNEFLMEPGLICMLMYHFVPTTSIGSSPYPPEMSRLLRKGAHEHK